MSEQVNSVNIPPRIGSLRDLALLFLKLGAVSFGGPAAHTAMIEDEVVRRRKWLTTEQFLDLVAATNLIPGPNSTELAIYIGRLRAGWPGLIVAGCCFILPAALIVSALAWAYVRFGALPQAENLLYYVKPVVVAVIAQALCRLARSAIKTALSAALGLAATVLLLAGVNQLAVLFAAGLFLTAWRWVTDARHRAGSGRPGATLFAFTPIAAFAAGASPVSGVPMGLASLFLFFLKVGALLFGSGYVLVAFLREDLVQRWGWLTEAQLLDAIAIGQFTPGPLFTTATFIGYLLAGPLGAAVSTIAIFLPAFCLVVVTAPLIPRIRQSPLAAAFLDGVVLASLAMLVAATYHLGRAACTNGVAVGLTLVAFVLLTRFELNSAWLVGAAALLGLVLA